MAKTQERQLKIVIGAKDAYSTTLKKAKKGIDNLTASLTFMTVAATASVTALFLMTKATAESADQVGKFTDRIGGSSQALSEYLHVAELTGINQATLTMGWQRQTRRVSEAAQGYGEAQKAIAELNLDVEHLNSLEPADQFEEIAEALLGVANQGDRVRLAMKFWDSEGVAMLQTVGVGTEALKEMRQQARDLGITFSEEDVKAAAAFNDELTILKGGFTGLQNSLSREFMPVLTGAFKAISDEIINLRKEGRIDEWAKDVSTATINIFGATLIGAAGVADAMVPIARSIGTELDVLWSGFNALPAWARNVGVVGAMMGGKKGAVVALAMLHITGAVKNSLLGMKEVLEGDLALIELAGMNTAELADFLEQQAAKSENINLIAPPPPAGSYAAAAEALVKEMKDALAAVGPVDLFGGTEGGTEGGAGAARGGASPTLIAGLEAKAEAIRLSLESEENQLMESMGAKARTVEAAFQAGFLLESERNSIIQNLELQHQEKLSAITLKGLSERQKFQRAGLRAQATTIFGELASITQGVAQSNRQLFEINKVSGIANAILSAYEGISKTLSKYPYPLNIAMAAAHGAAAFAQVRAIQNTTFTGGGTAPSVSGTGGGQPSELNQPSTELLGTDVDRQPAQQITINVQNPLTGEIGQDTAEAIIRAINEAGDERDIVIDSQAA